jgi:hypothetical protein
MIIFESPKPKQIMNFHMNLPSQCNLPNRPNSLPGSTTNSPANNWVSFTYTLEGEQAQAVLELRDATGKTVHQVQLSQPKGAYLWDTRELQPGTYYYSLKTASAIKAGKFVIVK